MPAASTARYHARRRSNEGEGKRGSPEISAHSSSQRARRRQERLDISPWLGGMLSTWFRRLCGFTMKLVVVVFVDFNLF
jgi:hypothetical protein